MNPGGLGAALWILFFRLYRNSFDWVTQFKSSKFTVPCRTNKSQNLRVSNWGGRSLMHAGGTWVFFMTELRQEFNSQLLISFTIYPHVSGGEKNDNYPFIDSFL